MVCLMQPTARTSWPRRDILVTLMMRSRSRLTSPWGNGNSDEQEMAKGIFLQTNVKSVPLQTIFLCPYL